MSAAEDPLSWLFNSVREFLEAMPGWEMPELLPPNAVSYPDSYELSHRVKEGDQIMVLSPSGYWHHGIFVGKVPNAKGVRRLSVVDVWGATKESSTISVRSYKDFVAHALGFARARYDNAPPRKESMELAMLAVEEARQRGFVYDARTENCEHFATLCRVGRWVCMGGTVHTTLLSRLAMLEPAPVTTTPVRGFKY